MGQLSINRRVFLAGGVVAAAMAFLTWNGFAQTMVYYVTVAELLAQGEAAYDRPVRVGGRLVEGTMQHDLAAGALAFRMSDGTGTLPVTYRGVKPDLLGYSAEGAYQDVVVEGKLGRDGTLRATQLIVKHGPEFEEKP
jgi:cytochrome c-type biogenesis protein CcmE